MKEAEQQLLDVLNVVSEQSKLNPEGKAFKLKVDCFSDCPNYKPLLEKLEQQYKVIRINQRPDERGLSKPDHSMFEDEQPAEYADYMSYHIALMPTFAAFYEQQYKSSVLGLDKLSGLAFLKVYDVMLDIEEALSMSVAESVDIPIMRHVLRWTILCPADSPKYRNDYSDARWKAAKFLMDMGVVLQARVPAREGWDSKIVVTVKSRSSFQAALDKMRANYKSQNAKSSGKSLEADNTPSKEPLQPKDSNEVSDAVTPEPDSLYELRPEHYDKAKGVLYLSPRRSVVIARRGKVKRNGKEKYFECWLLECVFNSVNTLKVGADFSKILSLHASKIGNTEKRKVRNAVDSINTKIVKAKGQKNLIKIQSDKVFVNNSYL